MVDFGAPGKTRRIPAGYSATVSTQPSGGLTIRRLPPAPDVKPLPATLTQLPATLKWAPSPATQHRLDIFESGSGRWVESRELDGRQFDISMLDNGAYEIHLAALTTRGTTGLPAVVPVKVDLQAKAASLVAPEEGSLADDDMPEFSWRLNGQNEVARVEVAEDESFNDLVTSSEWAPETSALPLRPLSPGQYYWRVVTEAGGTSVATSKTRKVVVNGSLPPVRIISINYVDNQVRVFWEKVRTAQEYHLQLSEEPEFQNIIKEATLPETTAALRLIPGRRYFVRLKALSDAPLTSRWAPGGNSTWNNPLIDRYSRTHEPGLAANKHDPLDHGPAADPADPAYPASALPDRLNLWLYDIATTSLPAKPSDDVAIVAIDELSLNRIGRWPWQRSVHAEVIRKLHAAGADTIVFDILFPEPSPDDAALARAMADHAMSFYRSTYRRLRPTIC